MSLEAINCLDSDVLYKRMVAKRCRFYGQIITKDPSSGSIRGWMGQQARRIH